MTMNYKSRWLKVGDRAFVVREDGAIMFDRKNRTNAEFTFGSKIKMGYRCIRVTINGKNKLLYVHRLVAEAWVNDFCPTYEVDHIDGNVENNNRSNLRMVSHAQNMRAHNKQNIKCTSKYRGVFYIKNKNCKKRWVAQIKHNYKTIRIGSYLTEKEAAVAYNNKAIELGWPKECHNIFS